MTDPWRIPDRPVPDAPRRVPKWFFIRRAMTMVFLAIFLPLLGLLMAGLTLGLFFIGYSSALPHVDWSLDRFHKTTSGVITHLDMLESVHQGSRHPWKLGFRFEAEGRVVDAVGFSWDPSLKDKRPGDPIEVEYDPTDPSRARTEGGSVSLLAGWFALATLLAILPEFIAALILVPMVLGRSRSERMLLEHGIGVEAEVLQVRTIWYIHFGTKHPYDVYYRFTDHLGRRIVGKDRTYHYAWAASLSPGEKIGVVYNPRDPTNNVLWLHGKELEKAPRAGERQR